MNSVTILVTGLNLSPANNHSFRIDVEGLDVSDLIDQIGIEEIMKHASHSEILEHIDIDTVIDHYGERSLLESIYND